VDFLVGGEKDFGREATVVNFTNSETKRKIFFD